MLVQGLGSVGSRLAEHLHEAGATLLLADVDAARATTLADELGAKVVGADDVIGTECDVFAPCATGKVLTEETIPHLRCRIVAGAANNQLASPEDGERLRDAGILFAPDFVINAGGVIHLGRLRDARVGRRDDGRSAWRRSATRCSEIFEQPSAKGSRPRPPPTAWLAPASPPPADERRHRSGRSARRTRTRATGSSPASRITSRQEQGRRDCAAAVRRESGLVAVEDGEVVGFLTYVHRFDEAAEITWMAVRADRATPGDRSCADRPARRGDWRRRVDGSCWSSRSRRAIPAPSPTTATVRRAPSTGRRASCSDATCAVSGIPTPPCVMVRILAP